MNTRRTCGAAGVTALLAFTACGGSSEETSSPAASVDSVATSTDPSSTDAPDSTPAPSSIAEAISTTTAPPSPPAELADLEGISSITVTTPASGNGERPLLSWDPIDSAATYALTLTRADGQAYWAWIGTEPQIWLGGSSTQPPADASGPILTEPMTLRVVAVGADDVIFAASQPAVVAP